jgi:hypothetical protein
VIFGKQRQRSRTPGVLIEDLDGLAPNRCLRGVDFTQVQHVALHHTAITETLILDDAPIAVRLAVFLPLGLAQEHTRRI